IINEIEAEIRHQMADKKVYIYIETDEYDPHYMEKRRKLVRPSH
ncbi:MAG TPA: cation transporter, partial [Enterococcus casseliflavus]|nr:cation transporter [Enterococcus casseliflavus]